MRTIWSSNKKGNAENFLDAAMIDKEFYDRVLALDGWMYQFKEDDFPKLVKFYTFLKLEDQKILGKFSRIMEEIDVSFTFWDESMLGSCKKDLQVEIIRQIKATGDEKLKNALSIALLSTCNFMPNLGEPVSYGSKKFFSENGRVPEDLNDDDLRALANRYREHQSSAESAKYESLRSAANAEYEALKREHGL